MGAAAVILFLAGLVIAYFIGTKDGREQGREIEKEAVASVLATCVKEDAAIEIFASRILGNLDMRYTRLYSRLLSELFHLEFNAKQAAARLIKEVA
jgi:hypothetical protein